MTQTKKTVGQRSRTAFAARDEPRMALLRTLETDSR